MVVLDRFEHWQCGYFLKPGTYQDLKAEGLEALRRNIVALEPHFAEHVKHLTDWHQLSFLSVASNRCRRWYKPGLLLIGDAAHTMTPAAGAGIKYAIEDAVVATNLLTEPLKRGQVHLHELAEVQRRREWPTRVIQFFSAFAVRQINRMLRSGSAPQAPALLRAAIRLPPVQKLIARFVGFGLWRVRLDQ
jgi:2-polyprenyl-6-methoxyphenol hydroxylase-like FAD-dependent oxidoreductase